MTNEMAIEIRNPRRLDLATYLTIGVMGGIGILTLDNATARLIALMVCLLMGLVYRVGFRQASVGQHTRLYFVVQTVLAASLLALRSQSSDVFSFLFFLLSFQ